MAPHKYYIPYKTLVGEFLATRGIRQGATDASILWSLCTHLVLKDLSGRYSHQWLHDHIIIYADDVHLRWTFTTMSDGLIALTDLSHVLRTFQAYGFNINMQKSVVLFRAVGRAVPAFTRKWIRRNSHGPRLLLPDMPFTLPIVSKTAYLGIILSCRAWETDTVNRRVQAAQMCFHVLKKWLTAQVIPSVIRFRLYLVPSLMYDVHEMDITTKDFRKTTRTINVHFRRMIRSPVHLTHESIQAFFERLNQTPPWILVQSHNRRLLQALAAKRQQAVDPAIANVDAPDGIVHNPDYPMSQLEGSPDTVPASA